MKDSLIREVRDAKKFKKSKKGGKKNGGQRRRKAGGKRKKGGRRRGDTKKKGGKKGKRKNRNRNGGRGKGRNTRQDTCTTFYNKDNTTAVRDFRYARNQIQKAKRAKKRVEKLEKLMGKAATAFLAGAAFFKNCNDTKAKALYDSLR